MKLKELCEGYDPKHKCQTPGTIYKTKFHGGRISIALELPKSVQHIDIVNYDDVEADIHYALEKVLKRYYFK
jgi:hypothetical protein